MADLKKSREYEASQKAITDPERPAFHVTGMTGWINDPNGFSTYKGEYHLFFQYHPFDVVWGPMHWGHVKTQDFVKWEFLPCAIAPDQPYDIEGCISGSAIEMKDGRQLLFYTGMTKDNLHPGHVEKKETLYQNHCIAIGDGIDFVKYEGNPNVLASTAPKGSWLEDFRDPKIWLEEDTYYAIMCSRPEDGSGQILLYKSEDALNWEYVSILAYNDEKLGKVWECPDLFELDGKYVLMVSPQEMESDGYEFHPGYNTIAFIGNYDKEQYKFNKEIYHSIDYGIDFYAPQTVKTFDGRRVMIAWMSNWDCTSFKDPGKHWFAQMTLPREIRVVDNHLIQNPVREIENYRTNKKCVQQTICGDKYSEDVSFEGIKGRYLDLTINVSPTKEDSYRKLDIKLAKDDKHYFYVSYNPEEDVIKVDRKYTGARMDVLHSREFKVRDQKGNLKIRFILDRNSVEMFINDGEQAATFVLYTPLEADGISLKTMGEANISIEQYELKSCEK
ncbi:MAG: glycoside hydrolase family 32 protein [Firmicutes bacterium]|nr:glycoside hydrolase family 32 protein [Bacillota bacterium]